LDSHAHLALMDADPADVLRDAASVGITRVVQVGIAVPSSQWAAQAAARWRGPGSPAHVDALVAIHPNEAPLLAEQGRLDEALEEIAALARLRQVVGLGETGLDRYRTGTEGFGAQEHSFRAHIRMAKRFGKALVIHDRDAHDDVVRVLLDEGAPDNVVFHCFSGGPDLARICVDNGWVMSFAGTVTFRNAQPLRDALALVPLELVLVETDAPFLTPMPHRGRPNAPAQVVRTLRAVAELKGVDVAVLAEAVTATADRVFGVAAG
jgi:TatD DNase family protein